MKRQFFYILLVLNFNVLFFNSVSAQNFNVKTNPLRVGVAGTAPFVFMENGNTQPQGISVNIWNKIANNLNLNYQYKPYKTVNLALDAMKNGDLDLVVGPVTITSQRVDHFKFSQPFYHSSLAIAYKKKDFSIWKVVELLFSFKLLIAIGIFLVILAIVGTMFWLAEKKASPDQFPADPVKGIGSGMWLAIATLSTTGYGDKAPVTLMGRIIAGTWMIVSIVSLIAATSMIAGIASVLTFSNLQSEELKNIEELNGKNIATISGSEPTAFLKDYNIKLKSVENLEDAIKMLNDKQVDAIIYDRPLLMYYINNHKDEDIEIAKAELHQQGYGFAFPKDSDLYLKVNKTLLELAENQEISEITEEYLGKAHKKSSQ